MSFNNTQKSIDLKNYRLFIFDLDGTLYDQKPLRSKITSTLLFRFLTFRIKYIELKIISEFRKQRELHKGVYSPTLITDQYKWCADILKISDVKVKQVVEFYMYIFPLRFLKRYMYKGAYELLEYLYKEGIKTAVYSDFPVDEKLEAMKIKADKTLYSANEPVCCMKPTKTGLYYLCSHFNISLENTIYIGDRDDTDGESARMAGVKFILLDAENARKGIFYSSLLNDIRSYNTNEHD
jgi:HAD superfamily hydrolase (TIGR01549 family)